MYKEVTIHVHNPTQEMYDSIPVPEAWLNDKSLNWKTFGNVTVFAPRHESERTTCEIEFKAYEGEDFRVRVTQINS